MHRVAFLGFNDIQLLDLTGPMETFQLANDFTKTPFYHCFSIALEDRFSSEGGLTVCSDHLLGEQVDFDTLVVPGGKGARSPDYKRTIAPFLQSVLNSNKRIITVCTGLFLLAGLEGMQGKKVTTHWQYSGQLAKDFPDLRVTNDNLYTQEDNFFSSAGILSGIDLSLRIIELDLNPQIAAKVAKQLVTYLRRSGHQSQFSESLKFQSIENDKLRRIHTWLLENPSHSGEVNDIAEANFISPRHLNRLAQKHLKLTAKSFVEHVKLEHSKILLEHTNALIKSVAHQLGYSSTDSFTRAFKRKYGVGPQQYQQHFNTH